MKTCFGYVRVSTQKQGEGVSLDAQRDAILAFAARSNISITQWFEEKETAAKSGRPIFLSMMKQLMKRKAEGIVLHKVDRGARNLADWAKFAELADNGIDVHFANETLDFKSRGGRLTADIQAVIAADYIRNLREECIKGIDGRLKQGLYPFKAPMGYQDNGGGKVKTIDPVKGPIVRQAFELYASGKYSLRTLPAELARRGLARPNGTPISKNGLERVLRNPFYCGLIKITRGGATYPGIHEPLISPTLFQAVKDFRMGRKSKSYTKQQYTLRGLFHCKLCGHLMIPEAHIGHVYYRCQTKDCETKTIREELLELAVIEMLSRIRISDDDIARFENEFLIWSEIRIVDENANTFAMQLTQIEEKLLRLTDALIDRLIDKDSFSARKEALLLDKARINEAKNIHQKTLSWDEVKRFLEYVKSLAVSYGMATPDERSQIVKIASSNRTVERKNVYIEPANWLLVVNEAMCGLVGGHCRDTTLSNHDMRGAHIEALISASQAHDQLNVSEKGLCNIRITKML